MSFAQYQDDAEQLLRQTGSRVTRGRVVVLAALLESKHALTHSEVEARIERLYNIDRVTVYRVLDWLTQQGLAHRIAGDDRVWRFNAEPHAEHSGSHPHFQCNTCGDVTCLEDARSVPAVHLPAGFRREAVELTVKGLCASCAPRRGMARKARAASR
jgi:Fur family transcriptional regulator, ferric uptake regulator